ncbi:MAG TPA: sensor domain-containing diguanylate cyclase [Longimicrobium sp.]|nr:sensor domain-containing diguanylate cyclase [Longimicrobium sp.]
MAALAILPRPPWWGLTAAAAALVLLALWVHRASAGRTAVTMAAWPPLHVLLFATGSTDSPLIALAAAWVVALGRGRAAALVGGWIAAAVLVPAVQWLHAAPPSAVSLARYELLLAVAAGLSALRRVRPSLATSAAEEPHEPPPPADPEGDDAVLRSAMEVVRRATDAHEATLWRADGEWRSAQLVARVAAPGVPLPDAVVALEGSPYKWAIEERLPQHVRRGKRDLPAPWAEEMLVVPVDLPEGVLALAYPGLVPPGADAAAVEAARHLSTLDALLKLRGEKATDDARVSAIAEAAKSLPGEIEIDAFARKLAATVRQGTGAAGVAVAVADEGGRGRVLHVDDTGPAPQLPGGFGEDESRLGLALKHAVDLTYDDLRRERDKMPLLVPGEQWRAAPRSAAIFPLVADGRALGAVAAWHPQPGRFGEKEKELMRLLGSIAPLPLRSARQYQELDHRAHTDALTGLPNRAAFEGRLTTLSHVYDRYARPFSLLVLDVDFFKKFNDTHGHEAGDRVLQHVAAVVRATVRDVDTPARLGGEEFVVLMPETTLRQSHDAAERIRRSIEARTVNWNGRPLSVTVSIGAASCPDCTSVTAEVLKLADEALYRAKADGRNRVASAPKVTRAPGVV